MGRSWFALAEASERNRDPDQDQHAATDLLTPLRGPLAEEVADLEPDQGHHDAHHPEGDSREPDVDRVSGQRNSHGRVVDAERRRGDQQAAGGHLGVLGLVFLDQALLEDGVAAGQDQDRAAYVLPITTEQPSHLVPQEEAERRHQNLEEAEGQPHSNPCLDVDPAEAYPDGPGEVAQPDRDADQPQTEDRVHAGIVWRLQKGAWRQSVRRYDRTP